MTRRWWRIPPGQPRRRESGVTTLEFVVVMLPLVMVLVSVLMIAIGVFVVDEAQGAAAEAAVVGAQATYSGTAIDVQQGYATTSTVSADLPSSGGSGQDAAAARWASDIMAPSLGWYQHPTLTMIRSITPGGVPGYLIGLYTVTFTGSLSPFLAPWLPTIPVSVTATQPFRVPGAQASG